MGIRQNTKIKIVRHKNKAAAGVVSSVKAVSEPKFNPTTKMGEYFALNIRDMADAESLGWEENIISENSSKKQYYREPELAYLLSAEHHQELERMMAETCRLDKLRQLGASVELPSYSSYRTILPVDNGMTFWIQNYEERDTGSPDFTTRFSLFKGDKILASMSFGQHTYLEKYDVRFEQNKKTTANQQTLFFELLEDAFRNCDRIKKLIADSK